MSHFVDWQVHEVWSGNVSVPQLSLSVSQKQPQSGYGFRALVVPVHGSVEHPHSQLVGSHVYLLAVQEDGGVEVQ